MIKNLPISSRDKEALAAMPRDPLIEVEDTFDYSKVFIEKPWGYEYSIFKNSDVDVWFLFLKPGHKTSMHCHPHKKTSLVIVGGKAAVSTLNHKSEVKVGDGFVIDKGVFHSTEALSPSGTYVLEIETPVNKKNLVRIDDLYGRSGKRYESGRYVQPRNVEVMHSFHEVDAPKEHKSFGECHVSFVSNKSDGSIFTHLSTDPCSAIILRGEMYSQNRELVHKPGDLIELDHSRISDLGMSEEVELLLIKTS